jgi:hypothetical protein
MLDEITAITMLFLVIGHGLLIKKCSKLTDEIEPSAQNLSTELKDITSILDDVADLLHEGLNGLMKSPVANTQAGMDLPSLLTNLFMSKVNIGTDNATETKSQEWEVLQNHPPPPNQTENEPN